MLKAHDRSVVGKLRSDDDFLVPYGFGGESPLKDLDQVTEPQLCGSTSAFGVGGQSRFVVVDAHAITIARVDGSGAAFSARCMWCEESAAMEARNGRRG